MTFLARTNETGNGIATGLNEGPVLAIRFTFIDDSMRLFRCKVTNLLALGTEVNQAKEPLKRQRRGS
jgi:hypothetical protein